MLDPIKLIQEQGKPFVKGEGQECVGSRAPAPAPPPLWSQ